MAGIRTIVGSFVAAVGLIAGLSACSVGVAGKGSAQSSAAPSGFGAGSTAKSSVAASTGAPPSGSSSGPAASTLPALVVQAADLPGYAGDGSAGPQSKSDNDDDAEAKCMGQPDPNQYYLAGYASDEFSNDTMSIDSTVTSYNSSAAISIDRAYVANTTQLTACLKQDASSPDSGLPSGTTLDNAAVLPPPAGAPANVLAVIDIQITTTNDGQSVKVYSDTALLVGKYVDESVTFTSVGARVPSSLLQSLTSTIAHRIATI